MNILDLPSLLTSRPAIEQPPQTRRKLPLGMWESLVNHHKSLFEIRQKNLIHRYDLGDHEHFVFDPELGTLVFFSYGLAVLKARIQIIGSLHSTAHIWRWGWGDASLPRKVTQKLDAVRRYGHQNGYPPLITSALNCDEIMAWDICIVSADLMGAQGVYRIPNQDVIWYVALMQLKT